MPERQWWKSGGWVTALTAVIASIVSLLTYYSEQAASQHNLALAESQQEHEIQSFYFKAAIEQTRSENMRMRVLRYLAAAGAGDEPQGTGHLQAWADGELRLIGEMHELDRKYVDAAREVREIRKELRIKNLAIANTKPDHFDWLEDLAMERADPEAALAVAVREEEAAMNAARKKRSESGLGAVVEAPTPVSGPLQEMLGRWVGTVDQSDEEVEPYAITLDLEDGSEGDIVGSVSYPDLNCWSQLTNDVGYSGYVRLKETIVAGHDGCVTGGLIRLKLEDDQSLSFVYYHPNAQPKLDASASLNRKK